MPADVVAALYAQARGGEALSRILHLVADELDADAAHLGIDLGHGYRHGRFVRDATPAPPECSDALADSGRVEACALAVGTPRRRDLPRSRITLLRNPDSIAFNRADRRRFALLLPHLNHALALAHEIDTLRQRETGIRAALERVPQGLVIVAADGEVLLANAQARALLAQSGTRVAGRLHWPSGTLARRFDAALAQAIRQPEGAPVVVPLAGRPAIVLCLQGNGDAPATCSVLVRGTAPPQAALADALAGHFGLTPAEFRLCQALAAGQTLKACAQQWQRSYQTLRSQMKTVLAKTGAHRQAELLDLLQAYRLG